MFQSKPYSAVTVTIENLTAEDFAEDDLSGIVELIEAIKLQASGPTEAARAIRKKLKYGNVHRQVRALVLLDGLIQNAGPRFQRTFADEPLLERLRVCGSSELSDAAAPAASPAGPSHKPSGSTSLPAGGASSSSSSFLSSLGKDSSSSKKSSSKKGGKKKPFNLEAEKEQMKSVIAESSLATINLLNALQSINREKERISDNQTAVQRFEICKQLRRRVLRYIHHVEHEQWLGGLLHANDELVHALMTYEQLDQSIDADSDSDDEIAEQAHLYRTFLLFTHTRVTIHATTYLPIHHLTRSPTKTLCYKKNPLQSY
ncbi:hypothetical protein PWT90_10939 [Aphanocladium album]|nr:hypothetical protein PWT90_10939 [Aphanocladium album]